MNTPDFNQLVKNWTEQTKKTLLTKADEYARGDRLSNFKKISHLNGCTHEKALMILVSKHIIALTDFVNDLDGGLVQNYERWNEKIGDIQAYMILLDALVRERIGK